VTRGDHVHLGVTSLSHTSNTFSGPVTLIAAGTVGITSPSTGSYQISATAGAAAAGGGGGLVLREQHTASASATLDFTTCISATYDDYLIELVTLIPATDGANLILRMSTDGGSSYDSGANYNWQAFRIGAAAVAAGANGATSIALDHGVANVGVKNATANGGLSGSVYLKNPLSSASYKVIHGQSAHNNQFDASWNSVSLSAQYVSTTAVNAFRILFSSGNITSGTVRVYGIEK
jgi:hypothetical protein